MLNFSVNEELTQDPKFREELGEVISELKTEYSKAAKGAKHRNTRLKRSPLLNLIETDRLTVDYVMAEFPKVAGKKSELPACQREIIGSLVFNAARRTVLIKQRERARDIEEKANARAAAEQEESK